VVDDGVVEYLAISLAEAEVKRLWTPVRLHISNMDFVSTENSRKDFGMALITLTKANAAGS
jgi:hypothetical protein